MSAAIGTPFELKLSFCISTLNRGSVIGATLESIIAAQATEECEIVVLDAASTDNTERVVSGYALKFDRLR
jgi:glycosyltransferase involved in cell wall biosynthesis